MGAKLTQTAVDLLRNHAATLQAIVNQISACVNGMEARGRRELLLPWNKRQNECVDILSDAAFEVEKAARKHFAAIDAKRPPHANQVMKRRQARQEKRADGEPPNPVGRPPKKGKSNHAD